MNEDGYKKALRLEWFRERGTRNTEQGAFEGRMLSLDADAAVGGAFENAECAWATDGGAGADAIRNFDHGEHIEAQARRRADYKRAWQRINRRDPSLLDVFELVVKNGTNKRESIWELMIKMQRKKKNQSAKQRPGNRRSGGTRHTSKSS